KVGESNALSKPVTSNSVSTPQESKGVNNDKEITPGMFRINRFMTSRDEKNVPNTVRASDKKKPIIVSQPPVFTTKDVNSDVNQICLWCVDSGCSKHMTGNLSLLNNFVWKFMGTVRFENDHVAAILGDRGLPAPFLFPASSKRKKQAKRNEKPLICKTGVAKSYPGSFPQRGLNDLLGIKRI
nr:integrase, catalytic region, zinc finger, CCHC-type, peptidase aspartic, catalytic [Tanacetum cinerariifolium]